MDEREIARLAVRRGLLTEAQLAQAEAWAQGGRSLVSVLLDLGHLRAQDLLTLRAEPGPSRLRKSWPYVMVAASIALSAALIAFPASGTAPASPIRFAPTITAPPTFEHMLSSRAFELLRRAEHAAGREEQLPPGWEPELARAAALLEQALLENGEDPDLRYALGRCRELLDQWEAAGALYASVLKVHPDHRRALLGAARVALLLQEPRRALDHTERALRASPGPESYFVHGRVLLAIGDARRARDSFRMAVERDRSWQPAVDALLRRSESGR